MELRELLTPAVFFFFIAALGGVICRLKIRGFSFDLAAVLLVAVLCGYCSTMLFPEMMDENFLGRMKLFSEMGTMLFVSAIAIASGGAINLHAGKKNFIFFLLGMFMACSGFLIAKLIGCLNGETDWSLIAGLLCGALTSTPGLASVCEMENITKETATIGYGISYLFGVIFVVLFVQWLTKTDHANQEKTLEQKQTCIVNKDCLPIVCLVALGGQVLSELSTLGANLLGQTGSILLCGIVVGFLLNRKKRITPLVSSLSMYRNFGLVMFFVGNGFSAGRQLTASPDLRWFLYGVMITAGTVLMGYVICRLFLKKTVNETACIIAGGMTSTPAMGCILRHSDETIDMSAYSFSYLGALLVMTIGVRLL